jgi:predicted nucleotidyltransferase
MDKTTINDVTTHLKKSLIASGIAVDGIALFGSALTGNRHKESDIDMIVISSSFQGKDIFDRAKMTVRQEIETQRKFNIPLDVLNMSPEEYAQTLYQSKIIA